MLDSLSLPLGVAHACHLHTAPFRDSNDCPARHFHCWEIISLSPLFFKRKTGEMILRGQQLYCRWDFSLSVFRRRFVFFWWMISMLVGRRKGASLSLDWHRFDVHQKIPLARISLLNKTILNKKHNFCSGRIWTLTRFPLQFFCEKKNNSITEAQWRNCRFDRQWLARRYANNSKLFPEIVTVHLSDCRYSTWFDWQK